MKEILIEGKYATAKVFAVDSDVHAIDQYAMAQIKMICDDEVSKDAKIRVMPDVHAGKVGPIGLTMKLAHDRIFLISLGPTSDAVSLSPSLMLKRRSSPLQTLRSWIR